MTVRDGAKADRPRIRRRLISDTELAVKLGITEAYVLEIEDLIPGECRLGDFRRWDLQAVDDWISEGCPHVR